MSMMFLWLKIAIKGTANDSDNTNVYFSDSNDVTSFEVMK